MASEVTIIFVTKEWSKKRNNSESAAAGENMSELILDLSATYITTDHKILVHRMKQLPVFFLEKNFTDWLTVCVSDVCLLSTWWYTVVPIDQNQHLTN